MNYSIAAVIALLALFFLISKKFRLKETVIFFKEKRIFYPICSFFGGLFLMVLCPGFWEEVSWRHASSFEELAEIFPAFINEYIDVVFIQQAKLWTILLILLVSVLIIGAKRKELKKYFYYATLSILPVIGGMYYFFSIIMGGSTYPDEYLLTWVNEPLYTFCFIMYLCCVISMLFGILYSEIKTNKKKILSVLIMVYLCLFSTGLPKWEQYQDISLNLKRLRQNIYMNEKMILLYMHSDLKDELIIHNLEHNDNFFPTYIKKIYNFEMENEPEKIDFGYALDKFYQKGGIFSESELENPKFKNLYDKDFILNTQKNK